VPGSTLDSLDPQAGTGDQPGSPAWYMTSTHPDAVAWREEQADVDADIEGLAKDERADELDRRMATAGVPPEKRIARLKAHFQARNRQAPAAE
jgi:hypothetical protein